MKTISDRLKYAADRAPNYSGLMREAAKHIDGIEQQRDELLAAAKTIEIDAEECLDFDECTAMLVPIDTYHKLMEAIAGCFKAKT